MGFYGIAPYFVCMAVIFGLAAAPVLGWADAPPHSAGGRVRAIDGLRGILALAVFFHHGAIYHGWLTRHVWALPPSRFYTQLGQSGVAFFFMITAYLFWGRLLRAEGRLDFRALYVGRAFRIGPLYLLAVAVMLGIVFWHTGLRLHVPAWALAGQLGSWAALGVCGVGPDVNGFAGTGILLALVTWTLFYEWLFYFSLVLTGFLARWRRGHLGVTAAALAVAVALIPGRPALLFVPPAVFLSGMVCAGLEREGLLARVPGLVGSVAVVVLLALDFWWFRSAYRAGPVVVMAVCFYLIVSGVDVFGLLTRRAAVRLGDVSYGIYLLQGLVLYGLFEAGGVRGFALGSPVGYWVVLLAGAVALVGVATLAHVAVERRGIAWGKTLVAARGFRRVGAAVK